MKASVKCRRCHRFSCRTRSTLVAVPVRRRRSRELRSA